MGNVIYRATVTEDHKFYDAPSLVYKISYKDSNGRSKSYKARKNAAIATNLINKYFTAKTPTITPEQSKKLIQDISTTFCPRHTIKDKFVDWYTLLRDAVKDFLSDDQKITPDEVYQIYERIDNASHCWE